MASSQKTNVSITIVESILPEEIVRGGIEEIAPEEVPEKKVLEKIKEKEEILFDLEINLITKEVFAGDKVKAEIELFNIAGKKVDVEVFSSIKDLSNNTIASKHQIVSVETRTSFINDLEIPSDIKPGTYTFHIAVMYGDQTWEAGESFGVIKKPIEIPTFVILGILIAILLIFIIILYYEYMKMKTMAKLFKRITEEDLIRRKH
nr:hypothetical protein [Candidatus Woesearchaeota archaeon]